MMFLQVPPVTEIRVTNVFGEPMYEQKEVGVKDDGTPETERAPAMLIFDRFLLQRSLDPKFSDKKDGAEAVELSVMLITVLRAGPTRGVYMLEDDLAKRLKEACLHPSAGFEYAPMTRHNYGEFLRVIGAMSSKDPRPALPEPAPAFEAEAPAFDVTAPS